MNTLYFLNKDLESFPLLKKEEEVELLRFYWMFPENIDEKDPFGSFVLNQRKDVFKLLVCCNVKLVIAIAKQFIGRGLDFEDLISEGIFGLMIAINRYDPRFNTRLSTYSSLWIKQSIQRALTITGSLIRNPFHSDKKIALWRKAENKLLYDQNGFATEEKIREILKLSPASADRIMKVMKARVISNIDNPNPEGPRFAEDHWVRSISSDESPDFLEGYQDLMNSLNDCTPIEQLIIKLRYGLEENEPHTLEQIAKKINRTKERVRQIQVRVIKNLKEKHMGFSESA